MILEVATLDIKPKQEQAFEAAFAEDKLIISNMEGYISHQLQKNHRKPQSLYSASKLERHHWLSLKHHVKLGGCAF